MRRFDYSFLAGKAIPSEIVDLALGIGELKAMESVRMQDHPMIFDKLESVAKVQSVKNSNAIEGIITTDKRIEQIVNQNSAPLNHSEMEIAGYRDALKLIHEGHERINLTDGDIRHLHAVIQQYSGDPEAGKYKAEDNLILEIASGGERLVRFTPVSAEETPRSMEQMLLAYRAARDDSRINNLLLIPCVILDFLCIHPFRDGNGRLSRLLSLLLLYKSGFDAGKYISFEEQINRTKGSYYRTLQTSSDGWHEGTNDYMPFVKHFIVTLYLCYKELDKRFSVVRGKSVTKEHRIEAIVLESLLPVTKRDILSLLPDVSETTVERVLGSLVRTGKIEKLGANRNARYIKKD